jgi:hypothetical protein
VFTIQAPALLLTLLVTLVTCGFDGVPTKEQQVDSLSLTRICAGSPAPDASRERTGLIAVHGALLAHEGLPAAWLPRRIEDVHIVACSEDGLRNMGSCGTYQSFDLFGPPPTYRVSRLRSWQTIRIHEAWSGKVLETRTFWGGVPPSCPTFLEPELVTDVYGSAPSGQVAFVDQWRRR